MIISTREEEEEEEAAADCQGLIGDLVIFSSVLSEQERERVCLLALLWENRAERHDSQITA